MLVEGWEVFGCRVFTSPTQCQAVCRAPRQRENLITRDTARAFLSFLGFSSWTWVPLPQPGKGGSTRLTQRWPQEALREGLAVWRNATWSILNGLQNSKMLHLLKGAWLEAVRHHRDLNPKCKTWFVRRVEMCRPPRAFLERACTNALALHREERAWVVLVTVPVSVAGLWNQTTRYPWLVKPSFSFVLQEEGSFMNKLYVEEETVPSISYPWYLWYRSGLQCALN